MKTNKLCIGFLLACVAPTNLAFSQEQTPVLASAEASKTVTPTGEDEEKQDEPSFSLSGSVDTYFHSTFGSSYLDVKAPGTSFANQPGFGLGMVNLIGTYSGEKAGFTADLVFGPRGREAVFGNLATGQGIINQMFAYYKLGKVTLNLGQFNTFLGYEVISPTVNFHYSTSYMFSWGPFSHTGLRADIDLGGGLYAKLAIMNPTDLVEFNPVNTYTFGGQLGFSNDFGGTWLNVHYGDQDGKLDVDDGLIPTQASEGATMQVDLTAGFNLSEKFYLGFNGTYRSVSQGEFYDGSDIADIDEDTKGFMGVALYPKVSLSESFALGLRAEYFQITKGYLTGTGGYGEPVSFVFARNAAGTGSVTEFTLSANYKVGGLTIIPEIRTDMTSESSYLKKGDGEPGKQMTSFNIAAVYKF